MSEVKVAVVAPLRNAENLLPGLLDGLAVQTRAPDEVIVVDDGSTDRSAALARGSGCTVLVGAGQGPYHARNLAWRSTDADVLAFVDARSRPRARWLDATLSTFDVAGTGLATSDTNILAGNTIASAAAAAQEWLSVRRLIDEPGLLPFAPTCNLLVRRNVLEHLDGFEERRSGADAELCWRAQAAGYQLGVARDVLMDWVPRERFRDYLEQHYRYGKGALLQRRRFENAGLSVLPPERLRPTVAKGLRNAAAIVVKDIIRSHRDRVHNAVVLAEVAYDLGYIRAHRRGASAAEPL